MPPPTRTADRPPPTRRGGTVDDLHGTMVADPYRWLEAGADDPEVARFIEGQNAYSEAWLDRLDERGRFRERLEELWGGASFGTPQRRGATTFQFRKGPNDDQDALYAADASGGARPLLDPVALGGGGTTALSAVVPSPDGRHVAYALSREGSDWRNSYVLDVATGDRLDDELRWSKYADVAWHPDGGSFAYVAYPPPTDGGALTEATLAPEIRLHALGSPQDDDPVLYRPAGGGSSIVWPAYLHEGDLLVVSVAWSSSGGHGIDLVRPGEPPSTLIEEGERRYRLLGERDGDLLFLTDDDAPRGCVVAIDPDRPDRSWRTLVPEGDDLLEHARLVGDTLVIESGVCARDRLAIEGRSNGGLLVGACLTQRPELFAAAVPAVGVLDMLRYHRFTIGWAWASDYGTADDPEQFATLLAYSPLQAVREDVAYPATLVETGDHDDRVVPAHSFKFSAALQAAQGGDAPILLRVTAGAGHGFGKPVSLLIDEAAARLAFVHAHTEGWS